MSNTIKPYGENVVLFKNRLPDSLFLSQVYKSSEDGTWDENSPKIVPHPGSLVIDEKTGGLYYVESVDKNTLDSTLKPCKIINVIDGNEDDENNEVSIISYGNDKFLLYFDDRNKPTQLNIDGKLLFYGANLDEYRLVRYNENNEEEIISLYVQNNSTFVGERIPLTSLGENSVVKKCTDCHTLFTINEGDRIELQVYDKSGILTATVDLFAKRATILNDLASNNEVIVQFDATCNQMLGDQFYIHQKQDPKHLAITPSITFSDGTKVDLSINNTDCFIYGLEDFVASFPGLQQRLIIKKFLSNREVSTISTTSAGKRFITCEKTLTVLANESLDGVKISVIPIWNNYNSSYTLKFVAYTDRRDKIFDATEYVTLLTEFVGNKWNTIQTVIFEVDLQSMLGATTMIPHRQTVYISVSPKNEYVKYLISDTSDMSIVYGADSSTIRRPIFIYDDTIKQYFIPTSNFKNMEAFLDSFYYKSSPMFNVKEEIEPVAPTHFVIRDVATLNTITTTPIAVENYNKAFNITVKPYNQYVGTQLFVEFLNYTGTEYQILYGVPVDVLASTGKYTDYNTDVNNLSN